jgi:hypothetical protein
MDGFRLTRRGAAALAAVLGCALTAPSAAMAAFPGIDGKIAYEKGGEIWVKNDGANNDVQITTEGGVDPAWSPDGARIAFSSDRDGAAGDIWVMNADGSDQRRLTTTFFDEIQPAWSPDGASIVFRGLGAATPQLVIMNANGSNPRPLTGNDNINGDPAWSPDGTRIAWRHFSGGTGISLMNADGSGVTVPQPIPNASRPSWSPDGSRIAFERSGDIWSAHPDGSDAVQLTDEGGAFPSWSPDGRKIAFSRFTEGSFELYVMNADGSVEIRNTQTAAGVTDWNPDWQPIAPPPDITGLPASVAAGGPGAAVNVDGTGFVRRSVVRVNGADRPTTFVSGTRLTAQLSAADLATPGSLQITVFTSPTGGGLSVARSLAVVVVQGPPDPRLLLTKAAISRTWKASRVRGTLRLSGSADRAGRIEVAISSGTGRAARILQRRRVTLVAGAFSLKVPLAPTLPPGTLRVTMSEVGGPAPHLVPASRSVRLKPPPEGVVPRAFVSALQRGPAARSLTAVGRIFAHFRFAARPKAGRALVASWTRDGTPVASPVRKGFSGTVIAFLGGAGRLPAGSYRCRLTAGGTLVAIATIRIR